jgi:ribosomal protein S18 acetylase RimI-like enzyme
MTTVTIRQATLSDLGVLKAIGRQTFKETFRDDNTAEDMENYLQATFNDDVLLQSLHDPDVHYFLACINDEVVGYIKLNEKMHKLNKVMMTHLKSIVFTYYPPI